MTMKNYDKFDAQKSVRWYSPKQLANTGVMALLSSVFGSYNDKREVIAALYSNQDVEPYDFSNEGEEFWLDYVADVGDGFSATYSIAHLLAQPGLELSSTSYPRGKVLVMGGDQVYPTPSREEYRNRLKGPYRLASEPFKGSKKDKPYLFAIPGNHDWYDGLNAFIKVFCQKRNLGMWQTLQRRSYFALKLPHNHWLLAIDIQLEADVDYNQLHYFEEILSDHISDEDKIILCTAEPAWLKQKCEETPISYKNLEYFKHFIQEKTKAKLLVTIAGDLHHYARYEGDKGGAYITAGGGGAFMHPTHNLPKDFKDESGETYVQENVFPTKKESRALNKRIWWFFITNRGFSGLFAVLFGIGGLLSFMAIHTSPFAYEQDELSLWEFLEIDLFMPILPIYLLLQVFLLFKFADANPYHQRFRPYVYKSAALLHGLMQAGAAILSSYFLVRHIPFESPTLEAFVISSCMAAIGFVLGSGIFGAYLFLCNYFLGNHDNEAFSGLRVKDYKNFLRMKITKEGLKIYPIGLRKTPTWRYDKARHTADTKDKLEVELIEDIPVLN